jgi:hypothetical protein
MVEVFSLQLCSSTTRSLIVCCDIGQVEYNRRPEPCIYFRSVVLTTDVSVFV